MNYDLNQVPLVLRAQVYATAAHAAVGQKRKYTGDPYITHPQRVAGLVDSVSNSTPEMVGAAWLHDVVEDTDCTLTDIQRMFGGTVGDYVNWLTDVSKAVNGNRVYRKTYERNRLKNAPPQVKTIKLADLIDNAGSIQKHDPEFAKVYMAEKKELIWALKEGDHGLLCLAMGIIQAYEQGLLDNNLENKPNGP
jgi:(p)ppGpp synthase/HD superfamily hydrolase